jgi:hypothetical protein
MSQDFVDDAALPMLYFQFKSKSKPLHKYCRFELFWGVPDDYVSITKGRWWFAVIKILSEGTFIIVNVSNALNPSGSQTNRQLGFQICIYNTYILIRTNMTLFHVCIKYEQKNINTIFFNFASWNGIML